MRTIEYFFTLQSPWACIGHAAVMDVASRHGAHVDFRPMNLGKIFPESGGLPLAKRHPARQRYRMLELQRWILKRGLPMVLHPKHWPFDASLVDKVVIAMVQAGASAQTLDSVVTRFFSATFEREENLGDTAKIDAILRDAGLDGDQLLVAAGSDAVAAAYADNATYALARGVIGAPSYGLDGEIFWGQDRLGLLDDALTSGRAPFSSDA